MNREIKFRAWLKADKKMFRVDGIRFRGGWVSLPTWGDDEDYNDFLLKDVELMQFTGLKDKNGKEIYERDVARWDRKNKINIALVEDVRDWAGQYNSKEWEVIGNIYENPELLNL